MSAIEMLKQKQKWKHIQKKNTGIQIQVLYLLYSYSNILIAQMAGLSNSFPS